MCACLLFVHLLVSTHRTLPSILRLSQACARLRFVMCVCVFTLCTPDRDIHHVPTWSVLCVCAYFVPYTTHYPCELYYVCAYFVYT